MKKKTRNMLLDLSQSLYGSSIAAYKANALETNSMTGQGQNTARRVKFLAWAF